MMRSFLELNLINPNNFETQVIPWEMLVIGVIMVTYSILNLISWVKLNGEYRGLFIRKNTFSVGRTASLKKYYRTLKIGVKYLSGNLLKTLKRGDRVWNINWSLKNDCLICYNEPCCVFLTPCNHFVFCKNCAENYFEKNDSCPKCNKKIERASKIKIQDPNGIIEVEAVLKIQTLR